MFSDLHEDGEMLWYVIFLALVVGFVAWIYTRKPAQAFRAWIIALVISIVLAVILLFSGMVLLM